MVAKTAAGLILGMVGAALVFFGVGLAAYAIFSALVAWAGIAGSAAITAFILLLGPAVFVIAARLSNSDHSDSGSDESAMIGILSKMAKEKPFLALLGAGLFGAADVLLKDRPRRR